MIATTPLPAPSSSRRTLASAASARSPSPAPSTWARTRARSQTAPQGWPSPQTLTLQPSAATTAPRPRRRWGPTRHCAVVGGRRTCPREIWGAFRTGIPMWGASRTATAPPSATRWWTMAYGRGVSPSPTQRGACACTLHLWTTLGTTSRTARSCQIQNAAGTCSSVPRPSSPAASTTSRSRGSRVHSICSPRSRRIILWSRWRWGRR
mmetsp:Transcript_4292/g.9774  ORF Transcript_4292/g.9774 Transcript_4292/m.9774 type:complete len:208 (-) Transcript_4292:1038-1661(-)